MFWTTNCSTGVLSPLSLTNPKAVICADELINTEPVNASNLPALCSNDEVVDSKLLNCMLAEDVNVFNEVFSSDEEINPKDIVWFWTMCIVPMMELWYHQR